MVGIGDWRREMFRYWLAYLRWLKLFNLKNLYVEEKGKEKKSFRLV